MPFFMASASLSDNSSGVGTSSAMLVFSPTDYMKAFGIPAVAGMTNTNHDESDIFFGVVLSVLVADLA